MSLRSLDRWKWVEYTYFDPSLYLPASHERIHSQRRDPRLRDLPLYHHVLANCKSRCIRYVHCSCTCSYVAIRDQRRFDRLSFRGLVTDSDHIPGQTLHVQDRFAYSRASESRVVVDHQARSNGIFACLERNNTATSFRYGIKGGLNGGGLVTTTRAERFRYLAVGCRQSFFGSMVAGIAEVGKFVAFVGFVVFVVDCDGCDGRECGQKVEQRWQDS